MRALINDALRTLIARSIILSAMVLEAWQRFRIRTFAGNQRRLRRKYRIASDTPVLSYGPRVVESIRHASFRAGPGARFALTSGSTGEPKKILYTHSRLRLLKFTFAAMFARACRAHGLKRTSLYVFSSFHPDASLTALLLRENKLPPLLSTLQAPYRVQQHPSLRALVAKYGAAAVRLWILTISNPASLYATNPSTISTFLDELERNWPTCSRLVKDWHERPQKFDRTVRKIARRIESRGAAKRLRSVATSNTPLSMQQYAPRVQAYICWTGGYLQPFLDRLAKHLPPPRYRLVPMYSMSTETVETETVFIATGRKGAKVGLLKHGCAFLPLANGVVYEFIAAGADDRAENLLPPEQLEPGETYTMVVSDSFGLRRYQTGDLFRCRRKLDGLPDLVFVRRRELAYSFIGEKVTAEQLTEVFDQLREQYPELLSDGFLTCVPSLPLQEMPRYKIVLITEKTIQSQALIASRCDELLSAMNCEYRNKRANGTLAPISFTQTGPVEFAERFVEGWETQFKFLPLYQRTWESERFDSSPAEVKKVETAIGAARAEQARTDML